jgi:hypothetical protein
MNVNDRLQPPESCTPQYPHKLDTVLRHSHGDIDGYKRTGFRGGKRYHMLRRWDVESTPEPPPTPYYYSEDDQRRSEAAISSSSPEMDSYGNWGIDPTTLSMNSHAHIPPTTHPWGKIP